MKAAKTTTVTRDPLWDQTPEMGPEGLIATTENPEELLEALKKNILETKRKIKQE